MIHGLKSQPRKNTLCLVAFVYCICVYFGMYTHEPVVSFSMIVELINIIRTNTFKYQTLHTGSFIFFFLRIQTSISLMTVRIEEQPHRDFN